MKKIRSKMISCVCLAAMAILCLGFALQRDSLQASAETANDSAVFYMDERASVKMMTNNTDSGIKFSVYMDKNQYDIMIDLSTGEFKTNYEVGAYVLPTVIAEGTDLLEYATGDNSLAVFAELPANKWKQEDAWMTTYVYLWDLPSSAYNEEISAVAYVKDGEEIIYRTDEACRSMASVAYLVLQNSGNQLTESELAVLNAYTANYDAEIKTPENEILVDISAGTAVDLSTLGIAADDVLGVYLGEEYTTAYSIADGKIIFTDEAAVGDTIVSFITANKLYKVPMTIASKVITKASELNTIFDWGTDTSYTDETLKYTYGEGKYYALGNNIDATGVKMNSRVGQWRVMEGVLDGTEGFQGTFDGRGHIISNLSLPYYSFETPWCGGIFGAIGKNGVVKNVAFENVIGDENTRYVSLLAGVVNGGVIENVYISSQNTFFSVIDNAYGNSRIENVVINVPGTHASWTSTMIDRMSYETVTYENVIAITYDTSFEYDVYHVHSFEESAENNVYVWSALETADDYYKTEKQDVNLTDIFDCSAGGVWTIDTATGLPVFKG